MIHDIRVVAIILFGRFDNHNFLFFPFFFSFIFFSRDENQQYLFPILADLKSERVRWGCQNVSQLFSIDSLSKSLPAGEYRLSGSLHAEFWPDRFANRQTSMRHSFDWSNDSRCERCRSAQKCDCLRLCRGFDPGFAAGLCNDFKASRCHWAFKHFHSKRRTQDFASASESQVKSRSGLI